MSFNIREINHKFGRINRIQFFIGSLLIFLGCILLAIITVLGMRTIGRSALIVTMIILILLCISYSKLLYGRTHDINQTGYFEVGIFIIAFLVSTASRLFYGISLVLGDLPRTFYPSLRTLNVGSFIIVMISHVYLCIKKGDIGENKYNTTFQASVENAVLEKDFPQKNSFHYHIILIIIISILTILLGPKIYKNFYIVENQKSINTGISKGTFGKETLGEEVLPDLPEINNETRKEINSNTGILSQYYNIRKERFIIENSGINKENFDTFIKINSIDIQKRDAGESFNIGYFTNINELERNHIYKDSFLIKHSNGDSGYRHFQLPIDTYFNKEDIDIVFRKNMYYPKISTIISPGEYMYSTRKEAQDDFVEKLKKGQYSFPYIKGSLSETEKKIIEIFIEKVNNKEIKLPKRLTIYNPMKAPVGISGGCEKVNWGVTCYFDLATGKIVFLFDVCYIVN